jgi:hypothetical protein
MGVDDVRQQLRELIGLASHLDGLLAERPELPDLELAQAKIEAGDLVARLEALADRLAPGIRHL